MFRKNSFKGIAAAVSCFALLFTCAVGTAEAQVGSIVVTIATPVLPTPDLTGAPLRIAKEGSIVTALESTGEWYRIEFNDPERGRATGFIQKKHVRMEAIAPPQKSADLSFPRSVVAEPQPPAHAADQAQISTANSASTRRSATQTEAPRSARSGVWFNMGLGYGSFGCKACLSRANGLSDNLTIGGSINDRFLIGFGTAGFTKTVEGELFTVGLFDARIRVYPSRTNGFFVTAGAGIGMELYAGEVQTGPSGLLGLGYDIRVGKNVSVTPYWNGFAGRNSTGDANVSQFGIGVTIH